MSVSYLPRLVDPLIEALLADFVALLVVGPRATGKTTTAARHARTFVQLDRPSEAAVFRADPDVALAGLPEPVLLDEWQMVPEVLGAVKRAVGGHLEWLRDQLGAQFRVGVVLHTGSRIFSLGDRIVAPPIASLWS